MVKPLHAWLLTPLGIPAVIVAEHEVQHFITRFRALHVPLTPAHCSSAIIWQEQIVPILNLGMLANAAFAPGFKLTVLAYQSEPLTPLKYVALAVRETPERITVSDEDVCDLPEVHADLWQFLAKTCVTCQGAATPIISVAMLDSAELRRYAEKAFAELGPTLQLSWKNTAAMSKAPAKAPVKLVSVQNHPKPASTKPIQKTVSPTEWNRRYDMGKNVELETEPGDEDLTEEFDDDDWDEDDLDDDDLDDDDLDDDDLDDDDLDDDDLDDDDWDEDLDDDEFDDDWDEDDLDDDDLDDDDLDDDDLDDDDPGDDYMDNDEELDDDIDDDIDDDLDNWDDADIDFDDNRNKKKTPNSRMSATKKSQG